jgi:hypothetical protein
MGRPTARALLRNAISSPPPSVRRQESIMRMMKYRVDRKAYSQELVNAGIAA